jgi:hypothetical protein
MTQKPKMENWKAQFWVNSPTRGENLITFVTGNCMELGYWDPDHAFALEKVLDREMVIPYRDPLPA